MVQEEVRELFKLIDRDGGGSIEFPEVKEFCEKTFQKPPTDEQIAEVISKCAHDGEDEIDENGFLRAVEEFVALTGLSVPEMVLSFSQRCYLDLFIAVEGGDGTGNIDKNSCRKLIESMGTNASLEDVRKLFQQFDADGSGEIDSDEFAGIIQGVKKLTGLGLSTLLYKFQQAQKSSAERKQNMFRFLEGGGGQEEPKQPPPRPKSMRVRPEQLKPVEPPPPTPPVPAPGSPVKSPPQIVPPTPVSPARQTRSPAVPAPRSPFLGTTVNLACAQCDLLQQQVDSLKQELDSERARVDAAEVAAAADQAAKREAEEAARALREQLAETEKRLKAPVKDKGLKEELAARGEELKKKDAELSRRQKKIKHLEEMIRNASRQQRRQSVSAAGERELELERRLAEKETALQGALAHNHELEAALAEAQLNAGGSSDAEMATLNSYVWTLETALEIRAREIERLSNLMADFIKKVSALDSELAQAMMRLMHQSQQQAVQEQAEAFGGQSMEEVAAQQKEKVKQGRRRRKRKEDNLRTQSRDSLNLRDDARSAESHSLRAELEVARSEARKARSDAIEAIRTAERVRRGSMALPSEGDVQQRIRTAAFLAAGRAAAEQEAALAELRRAKEQSEQQLEHLKQQLRKAQEAILSGAGVGFENEVKLHRARKALQLILDSAPSSSPARARGELTSTAFGSYGPPPRLGDALAACGSVPRSPRRASAEVWDEAPASSAAAAVALRRGLRSPQRTHPPPPPPADPFLLHVSGASAGSAGLLRHR
eukprot:TRINITY_DN14700_c0_g1_i1.p1 TRINITY_DN14700_c0_g1~~TRINITY_DN14700_c0_g1_i1.p1  ORF type:complete len:808 (+),score=352.81 TRINITY_DN14700_c0_g1_i1:110-2425(+)